jgi:hypothetical protein
MMRTVKRFDGCFRATGLLLVATSGAFFGVWQRSLEAGMWMVCVLGLALGLVVEAGKELDEP